MQELIKAVRKHAEANYESDGWDFLVECWSDDDIAEQICEGDSEFMAILRCERVVSMLDEQRRAVQNEAW